MERRLLLAGASLGCDLTDGASARLGRGVTGGRAVLGVGHTEPHPRGFLVFILGKGLAKLLRLDLNLGSSCFSLQC